MGRVSGSDANQGVQMLAEELLTSRDAVAEDTPPGFSDESGQEEGSTAVRRSDRQLKN